MNNDKKNIKAVIEADEIFVGEKSYSREEALAIYKEVSKLFGLKGGRPKKVCQKKN